MTHAYESTVPYFSFSVSRCFPLNLILTLRLSYI